MNALDAAEQVLRDAREPLHYRDLTKRMLDHGLWTTRGKTPWETVNARLAVDIRGRGEDSRFRRTAPGMFTLNDAGEPRRAARPGPQDQAGSGADTVWKPAGRMSFLDAAEEVLRSSGLREPMHYEVIATQAIAAGLIATEGKTPGVSLSAMVGTDIRRREARGEPQRFVRRERGMIGLAEPVPFSLATEIEEHNQDVREKLLASVRDDSPAEFERLVAELLSALEFEEVERTPLGGDGGIDVRGTLVVGGVVYIRMAVQAKRWKNNVPAPIVQQVRGSLGAHEQGLVITTSDFSKGARQEAARADASPVALMNGEQLVDLLIEKGIGVHRSEYYLLSLDNAGGASPDTKDGE